MTDKEMITSLSENTQISVSELSNIAKAIMQVYPMIVLANLSQNTYSMLRNDGFLHNVVPSSGYYTDLIDDNVQNIHPNYQRLFLNCFSREHLLESFKQGKNEVYAELYQKSKRGQFHWVSTHVIKVENESGDISHICFNRILDGIVEGNHVRRK